MHPQFPRVLQKHLTTTLAALPLEVANRNGVKTGTESDFLPRVRVPRVFIGDLPVRSTVEAADFPCVLIVPAGGWHQEGESVVTVGLVCCVYNAEEGDLEAVEMDLALLLSAVMQALLPCASSPLEKRYRLAVDPRDSRQALLEWEKSEAQPRPFMQATMMTHWCMKGSE